MAKYATKEDIDKLTKVITDIAKVVGDLKESRQEIPGTADLSKIKEPTPITPNMPLTEQEIESVNPEKVPIPPAWRKMVDEILGIEFGVDVVYPQSGSGFLFKVIVPTEKSNMSSAHKEFYKVDVRTKAISYADGIEGVRKFCELVAANLKKKQ